MKKSTILEQVFQIVSDTKKLGISQNTLSDKCLSARTITLNQRPVVNFASCSYLGLEQDSRLIEATIDATRNFGTQFSASRAYLSVSLYGEAESLLSKLFNNHPTIIAPTTSLGHLSVIPTLIGRQDAIVLDQQVHASVQNAVKLAVANGTHVEVVRHNRMDYLEARIKKLSTKFNKIWYMADGVYSMYGDFAPIHELHGLLDKYDQFHLYIDDAHGMSWMGKNGVGYVLNEKPLHQKMIMLTSLNKSFSAAGGAIICPNEAIEKVIRYCGSTLMFSGPVQPPMLGAIVASAKIHLSGEVETLQEELQQNINLFKYLLEQYQLPLLGGSKTPIFYIGIGKKEHGYRMVSQLLKRGFYTSLGAYPSVPLNRTGVRVTINQNHTKEQIETLARVLKEELSSLLQDEKMTLGGLYKYLKLQQPVFV